MEIERRYKCDTITMWARTSDVSAHNNNNNNDNSKGLWNVIRAEL